MKSDISTLVPFYNNGRTIRQAVMSVIEQDSFSGEIIIYDDGTKDEESLDELSKLENEFDILSVITGKQNCGAGIARGRLIEAAKHPLAAFLDADDVWAKTKIEKQLSVLEDPSVGVCYSSYYICTENLLPVSQKAAPPEVTYRSMLCENCIPTSTSIFRTEAARAFPFPALRQRQDYAFWLLFLKSHPQLRAVGLGEPLAYYRKSSGSLSSSRLRNIAYNYKVFRDCVGYGRVASAALTARNGYYRYFRSRIEPIVTSDAKSSGVM